MTLIPWPQIFLALGIIAGLSLVAWFLIRYGRRDAQADILEAENEIRNEARRADQSLDAAERARLRKRYGKRGNV